MRTDTRPESVTRFLGRSEGRIAYDDTGGSGPLVVAIPSMGDVRQEYRFLRPALVLYRVVTADVRGHGESSVGWSDYSAAAVGADIVALVEHLGARSAAVIGTSMAGGAAAWAAADRPDVIRRIVMIAPFVRDMAPPSAVQGWLLKVLLARPWGPAAWSQYYRTLYPTHAPADLTAYRAALAANLREPGRFEALQAMVQASKAAVERRLAEVRAAAIVMIGTKDPDFEDPVAEARLVAERVHGTVCVLDGAGHYPHAEMPERTAAEVLAFLSGADAAEAGSHGR